MAGKGVSQRMTKMKRRESSQSNQSRPQTTASKSRGASSKSPTSQRESMKNKDYVNDEDESFNISDDTDEGSNETTVSKSKISPGDKKKNPSPRGKERRKVETNETLGYFWLVPIVLVLAFLLHKSDIFDNYSRIFKSQLGRLKVPADWEGSEAWYAIERFHSSFHTSFEYPGRPAVLLLESTKHSKSNVEKQLREAFSSMQIMEFSHYMPFNVERVLQYDSHTPIVVIVNDVHKATRSTLDSYLTILAAETYGTGIKRRSAKNLGFLFLGSSLSPEECPKVKDVLRHVVQTLDWSHTFETRITDSTKIC